jgi:RNA polymerase sigma factor (TIGR02999 family)
MDLAARMSDSAPNQEPKPQPQWSGGPPRPPKKTARGLQGGSPGDDDPTEGHPEAEGGLFSRAYHDLRRIAAEMMAREAPDQTLQATALVDEAWMRLFGSAKPHCADRAYLFAAVGKAMRRILVENARRKKRLKRGGNLERVDIEHVALAAPLPDDKLLALDEALDRLAEHDPFAAKVVDLCYFAEFTQKQAAELLDVSLSKVERTWAYARAWLFREIE